jgi:VWFA-related protein
MSRIRIRSSLAVGALALAAAAPMQTQTAEAPPALFGERVDVEVVNVDVVVTDRDGHRVTDLERDEFELRIDGRPVAIEYFAAPRPRAAGEGAAPLSGEAIPAVDLPDRMVQAAPSSQIIVFVDQSALEVKASNRIVEGIREFVLPRMDGSTAVLVATFVDSLRVVAPVTTDRAEVERALVEVEKLRGRGTSVANERNAIEADVRSTMVGAPSSPVRRGPFLQQQRARLEEDIRAYGERALDRQQRAVRALQTWVNALASIEGRKSLLLATNGFSGNPTVYLQSLADALLSEGSAFSVVRQNFSTTETLATQGHQLMVDFEEMLRDAENARVAFYTISPRTPPVLQGTTEFGGMGIEAAKPAPRDISILDADSSVVRMAAVTGGGNLYLDDGLSRNLVRVIDDEAAAYSLGFTTSESAGDRDHRIEVRLKREGLRVQHRESYRRRTLEDRSVQALAAAASLRSANNPLGIAIELGAPVLDAKQKAATVPLLVRIPLQGLALVPEGGKLRGRLSARVAILDAKKEQRTGGAAPIEIAIAAVDEAKVASHNWAYRAELRLAPGPNRIAAVIVDEIAGVIASTTAEIDVPGKSGR